jgi:hypothetical protein
MESNPQNFSYDKVDPEEIIIKLKELIVFFQRKKQESSHEKKF